MPAKIRLSAKLRSLMSLRLGSDTLYVYWLNAPGLNSTLSLNSKRQLCFTWCIIANRLKFCYFCFEFTSFTCFSLLFWAGIFFYLLSFSGEPHCLQAARPFVPYIYFVIFYDNLPHSAIFLGGQKRATWLNWSTQVGSTLLWRGSHRALH